MFELLKFYCMSVLFCRVSSAFFILGRVLLCFFNFFCAKNGLFNLFREYEFSALLLLDWPISVKNASFTLQQNCRKNEGLDLISYCNDSKSAKICHIMAETLPNIFSYKTYFF